MKQIIQLTIIAYIIQIIIMLVYLFVRNTNIYGEKEEDDGMTKKQFLIMLLPLVFYFGLIYFFIKAMIEKFRELKN